VSAAHSVNTGFTRKPGSEYCFRSCRLNAHGSVRPVDRGYLVAQFEDTHQSITEWWVSRIAPTGSHPITEWWVSRIAPPEWWVSRIAPRIAVHGGCPGSQSGSQSLDFPRSTTCAASFPSLIQIEPTNWTVDSTIKIRLQVGDSSTQSVEPLEAYIDEVRLVEQPLFVDGFE